MDSRFEDTGLEMVESQFYALNGMTSNCITNFPYYVSFVSQTKKYK